MKPQIIENFIGKKTCEYINSYMKNSDLLDDDGKCIIYVNKDSGSNAVCMGWTPEIFSLLDHLKDEQSRDSLIYDLFNLIGQNMSTVFGFKNSDIVYETSHYKCFGPEGAKTEGMNPHVDHWGEGGTIYTAVLYFNENYEGGDIVFYGYGEDYTKVENPISYKPKTGSLIYFDGYTMHSVNDVIAGERACLVLHIRNTAINENNFDPTEEKK